MGRIKFRKPRYWHFDQETQEHYFNLRNQISKEAADSYLVFKSIAPLIFHVAMMDICLKMSGKALKSAGVLK